MYTKGAASSALYFSNNRWDNTPRAIIPRCYSLSLLLEHTRTHTLSFFFLHRFAPTPLIQESKKGQQIIINAAYLSKISFHKFVVIFLNFSLWECTWNTEQHNRQKRKIWLHTVGFEFCLMCEIIGRSSAIMSMNYVGYEAGFCRLCSQPNARKIYAISKSIYHLANNVATTAAGWINER